VAAFARFFSRSIMETFAITPVLRSGTGN
jgi:hypothetical protein